MKPFDEIYKNVPQDQKEAFRKFRSTHPYTDLTVGDAPWKYISSLKGKRRRIRSFLFKHSLFPSSSCYFS